MRKKKLTKKEELINYVNELCDKLDNLNTVGYDVEAKKVAKAHIKHYFLGEGLQKFIITCEVTVPDEYDFWKNKENALKTFHEKTVDIIEIRQKTL